MQRGRSPGIPGGSGLGGDPNAGTGRRTRLPPSGCGLRTRVGGEWRRWVPSGCAERVRSGPNAAIGGSYCDRWGPNAAARRRTRPFTAQVRGFGPGSAASGDVGYRVVALSVSGRDRMRPLAGRTATGGDRTRPLAAERDHSPPASGPGPASAASDDVEPPHGRASTRKALPLGTPPGPSDVKPPLGASWPGRSAPAVPPGAGERRASGPGRVGSRSLAGSRVGRPVRCPRPPR